MTLLAARNVHKTYRLGHVRVPVLHGVSLSVSRGESVAVLGSSGSGKSTLLHLLGGLDRPDADTGSTIEYDGKALQEMSARELDRYRSSQVGFVFQFYHLLPELSVIENVAIGAMVRLGKIGYVRERGVVLERAKALLDSFGLEHRLKHRPRELSGGERQRVAIARALINEPQVLLADEPTGNLDRATGQGILDVLTELRTSSGLTMVMVTHDPTIAERADRVVHLLDGVVVERAKSGAAVSQV